MPTTQWISGHAAQLQLPDEVITERFGWGIVVDTRYGFDVGTQLNRAQWIHFAIPTPIPVPTITPSTTTGPQRVTGVRLDFLTDGAQSAVLQVDVWDGRARIASFPGLNLFGNNPGAFFPVTAGPISRDVGISVLFLIPAGITASTRKITFFAAGADFSV